MWRTEVVFSFGKTKAVLFAIKKLLIVVDFGLNRLKL